ncbi:MAG: transposase [Victivallales bacterium]
MNPHPGGEILLNPSDREAEIGHKGVGYQVQITESCSAGNDVQLITSAIPQGGSQSDMASFPIVMKKLEEENALLEKMYSDAGYGSDDNYVKAAEKNVTLVASVPSRTEGKSGLEECEFEDDGRMLKCPAGKRPMYREFKNGHGRAVFHVNACNGCPLRTQCRSRKKGKWNREFRYNQKDLRTRMRLQQESTAEFRSEYRKRIPIEGLNGRLKQYTQLQRLRVRGRSAVYHTISAILAMHNIMQAARYAKIQTQKGIAGLFSHFLQYLEEIFSENHIFKRHKSCFQSGNHTFTFARN